MTKAELVDALKVQRDVLSSLIAELEAADSEILAHTEISDLNPKQFGCLYVLKRCRAR